MSGIIKTEESHPLDLVKANSKILRNEITPKSKISIKPGTSYKYVKQKWFYNWLDENYPGWSWELSPDFKDDKGGFVTVIGILTVMERSEGIVRRIHSVGTKEAIISKEKGLISHPYYKSAETDALKRACIKLGAFNDIYGEHELDAEDMVSEADIQWYFETIVPTMIKAGKTDSIRRQYEALLVGIITINDLKNLKLRLEEE